MDISNDLNNFKVEEFEKDENNAEKLFAERNKPKKKKPIRVTPQTTKTVPFELSDIPDEHFMDTVDYVPDGEQSTPKDPDDYSEEFLRKNDEAVKKIYEDIKRKIGKAPNFEELVKIYIEKKGSDEAIQLYNFFKRGWINNEYQKADFDNIFEYLFTNSIDEAISHFESGLNKTTETKEEPKSVTKKLLEAEQLFAERNKPKKKKPIRVTPQTTKTVPFELSDVPDEHFMDAVDYVPDGEQSTPKDPDDYSEEFLEKNDEAVKKIYESIKRKMGKAPNFEELVKIYIEKKGSNETIQLYNFFKRGWINNEYSKTDFDSIFEYLFTNEIDEHANLFNNEESNQTTKEEPKSVTKKLLEAEKLFAERNKPKKNKRKKKKPITITPQTTKTVPYDLSDIADEHFMDAVDYVPDGEESTPKDPDDYSEEFLRKNDEGLKKTYEAIKRKIGKAPNFEELVKILIEKRGANSIIQVYNLLKKGWINNEYQKTDFDSVFEYLFTNEIDDYLDHILSNETTETKEKPKSRAKQILEVNNNSVPEAEAKAIDHVKTTGSPVIQSDEEGNVLKEGEISVFRIATPKLKFAHLSLPYKRKFFYDEEGEIIEDNIKDVGNELNVGQMDTTHLLDPNLYNPGEKLDIRVADNYKEVFVTTWDEYWRAEENPKTFEQWANDNNVEEGSKEWIEKVPMALYNKKGEFVSFIHDPLWYNENNIAMENYPDLQEHFIQEARANINSIRHKVAKNQSTEVQITVKRIGTYQSHDNNETAPLNEEDPTMELAIADKDGILRLNGDKPLKGKITPLGKKEQYNSGHVYQLRRGVTSDQLVPLPVRRSDLKQEHQDFLNTIIEAYINKDNKKHKNIIDKIENLYIEDKVKLSTKLSYIVKNYIRTAYINVNKTEEIQKILKDIPEFVPFLFFSGDAIIFGVKGLTPVENGFYKLHPDDTSKHIDFTKEALEYLKNDVITKLLYNTSIKGLAENTTTFTINKAGEIIEGKKYRDFTKDNLETSIKAFNIGTEEKPNYITFIQPVIHFEEVSQLDNTKSYKIKPSQEILDVLADRVKRGRPLTQREEEMYRDHLDGGVQGKEEII